MRTITFAYIQNVYILAQKCFFQFYLRSPHALLFLLKTSFGYGRGVSIYWVIQSFWSIAEWCKFTHFGRLYWDAYDWGEVRKCTTVCMRDFYLIFWGQYIIFFLKILIFLDLLFKKTKIWFWGGFFLEKCEVFKGKEKSGIGTGKDWIIE